METDLTISDAALVVRLLPSPLIPLIIGLHELRRSHLLPGNTLSSTSLKVLRSRFSKVEGLRMLERTLMLLLTSGTETHGGFSPRLPS